MNNAETASRAVTSKDGTTIAYNSIGAGPAIILIPGALETADEFGALAYALSQHHFTVYTIERRGRGSSGPQGDGYSMAKECEDVLALQKQTSATFLVGHSYGGLIALETASVHKSFGKIAVYEPGVSINGSIQMDWIPRYKKQLAEGKYLDAFTDFSVATGPKQAQSAPRWLMKRILRVILGRDHLTQILSLLPESLLEHQEVARLDTTYRKYAHLNVSVMLMYGGKSCKQGQGLAWVDLTMKELANTLPQSETKEFPKLDHFGLVEKGASEVAEAVGEFFMNSSNQTARKSFHKQ
jgi:pimeloyl-ACP methyl ester carboxylesterase